MERTILLVHDDPQERSRVLNAFSAAAPEVRVCPADDAAEVRQYVSGTGKFAQRQRYPMPQLLLLDLDAAKGSVLEALQWLRGEASKVKLPVIAITSGADKSLVDRAYKLGASSCVLKGEDDLAWRDLAKGIADYAAVLSSSGHELSAP